jgi:hypothetical protein
MHTIVDEGENNVACMQPHGEELTFEDGNVTLVYVRTHASARNVREPTDQLKT